MTGFKKTIEIHPGYDRRTTDPRTNGGVHGAEVLFKLAGPKAVLTFAVYTDWTPLTTQKKHMEGVRRYDIVGIQPHPVDFVLHSPMELPNTKTKKYDCPYLPEGEICWSDISITGAVQLRDTLLTRGSEGVWREMINRYESAFGQSIQVKSQRRTQ